MNISSAKGVIYRSPSFNPEDGSGSALVLSPEGGAFLLLITDHRTGELQMAAMIGNDNPEASDPLTSLEQYATHHPWIKGSYCSTRIVFTGRKVALIPTGHAEPESYRSVLSLNFDLLPEEKVLSCPIETQSDATALFATDNQELSRYAALFGNPRYLHIASLMASAHPEEPTWGSDAVMIRIHISGKHFLAFALNNGNIQYFNSFEYSTSEEFLFYLVAIVNSLRLQASETPIVVSGTEAPDSELLKEASRVFPHLQPTHVPSKFQQIPAANHKGLHLFTDLLTLTSCES
jgi:hypothetical protein